ncbi:uncharacterized protein A1O5_13338 [Cladophialophora psammophila CBS 110553]|uniref:Uncharacterized protein n=1 Tax=Cladophialophora psammophila CBS 110553 TaxID=1182543 RepID=W9W4A0_9EURO|nr:uncharacterized protein A1O5_13338 [Cladophialophora psammophila CBS 110553]EXJ53404.1 hypothetical protein A1O5_13338 [Cladophialophora psammophila CBS 110553]
MSAFLDKLKVTRSEGMSGIGPDQGALRDKLEMSNEQCSGADFSDELGSGKGQELDRAPNAFGGPSFGRTSAIPRHESEALNKVDPRIGYDADEIRQEELERYETKYGKPSGNISDARMRGTEMAGIGPDQSALAQTPGFRAKLHEQRKADRPEK